MCVLLQSKNNQARSKTGSDPDHLQNSENRITVDFDGLNAYDTSFDDTQIIQGEGWIRYKLPSRISDKCTRWSAYIMEMWDRDSNDPQYDDECDSEYVGGVYDPTVSCINEDDGFMESANSYCDEGTRCPGETDTLSYFKNTEFEIL